MPHIVLAVFLVFGGLMAFYAAAQPRTPDTNVALDAVAGVIGLVGAAVVLLGRNRLGVGGLVGPLTVAIVLIAAITYGTPTGQGQLVAGTFLMLTGIYVAVFLPWRFVVAELTIIVVFYGAALIANPLLETVQFAVIMETMIVAVTLVTASLVARLRHQAVHDALTGALNRRGLEENASMVHDLNVRDRQPTSIVMIDLDGFKAFNDRHGHDAGDRLLAATADDWRTVLRRTDILARSGGDEFVVVLPGTDIAAADVLVARMRTQSGSGWSAGVTSWEPGEPLSSAMGRADARMYEEKRGNGTRAAN